ncbi:MAG TPA: CPBP family intramembrane glutamic endopeptidase [Kofleriaceae bacterium]|nr:CPBP family intramembrane glutamic endopeptidase [Kofleriaceae bacterium]
MDDSSRPPGGYVRGAIAFVVAFCVYVGMRDHVTPRWEAWLEPSFGPSTGSGLFLRHLLTFSLLTAAVALATWWLFARLGWLASPRAWLGFGPEPRRALAIGAIAGVALSALVVVVGVALGERVHFHPDGWSMAGNVFSNYYEEVTYRGLLMQTAWCATGSRIGGVVLSSAVFGWSHMHGSHALFKAIAVAIAGGVFGALAIRTRSLGGAWTAHQVSDMILDSL